MLFHSFSMSVVSIIMQVLSSLYASEFEYLLLSPVFLPPALPGRRNFVCYGRGVTVSLSLCGVPQPQIQLGVTTSYRPDMSLAPAIHSTSSLLHGGTCGSSPWALCTAPPFRRPSSRPKASKGWSDTKELRVSKFSGIL